MVYGAGCKGNLKTLARLIKIIGLLPLKNAENERSLIYILNLTHFIDIVIRRKIDGVLLPQDKKPISVSELAFIIAKLANTRILNFKLPKLIKQVLYWLFPHFMSKLYSSLSYNSILTNTVTGYVPPYSTEEGLRAMIASISN